jgi:predicted DNA-binding WGR domain protein
LCAKNGTLAYEAELAKRSAAANQARFYRMAVWPGLFGGYSLAREYGRIGQPGRLRLDPYPDEPQAVSALHKLLRRKTRRGYQPLSGRSV